MCRPCVEILEARRMRGGRVAPSRTLRRETLRLEHNLAGKPASTFPDHAHLSCESGIWMSPLMCLIGPADDGMISKSKISVGSQSVAQAFGTSTTPEIWP